MRENKTINISTKKANIKCIPTLDSFTETLFPREVSLFAF